MASGTHNPETANVNVPAVYLLTFVLSMIAAMILALVIHEVHATTVISGARVSFMLWLGFILTVRVSEALFNGTSMRLVMIDSGYRLVWAVVMGIILAVWR